MYRFSAVSILLAAALAFPIARAQTSESTSADGKEKEETKDHHLKLNLDPLLDLAKAWTLTPKSIETQFSSSDFTENPFIRWEKGSETAVFPTQPFSNVSVAISLFDGKVEISEAQVTFKDELAQQAEFLSKSTTENEVSLVRAKVSALLGAESKPSASALIGFRSKSHVRAEQWSSAKGKATLEAGDNEFALSISRPEASAATTSFATLVGKPGEMAFFVRLDQLLAPPAVWNLTPDAMEKSVLIPRMTAGKSPFFSWNTTSKDSARFAQKLFNNTDADLLLFDDSVKAEEANIEFKSGRTSKIIYTLLTRGNHQGPISADEFDKVFKNAGRAMGTVLGVRPTRTTMAGKTLLKTEGWLWTTPHTLALLEFNAEAPKGKVEFLRLTLTPAKARAELLNLAGLGDNATTRKRDSLVTSVKRDNKTGDVEITGVPMRDQGQKGYCVAASCERLFRYLGVPCDMDELAKLVSADAGRGASPSVMYSSLTKIDQQYNMRVKLLKIPNGYGLGEALKNKSELERAHKADLGKLIQENVNQGLPLLWCVQLAAGESGVSPGTVEPKAPTLNSGPRVGHMRLIIGYNSSTGGVIYTDSWGAGHERKVMSRSEAEAMTTAVFSMAPSR